MTRPQDPTRLALAGAGWAGRAHTLAATAGRGASIVAVAASSVGGAEDLGATLQATPMAPDRLPANADAVIIATPSSTHAELALRLLGDSVPVLIESPLAATLAECDAIIEAAERSHAAACSAENLLFSPALDLAAARTRLIGRLEHLDVQFSTPTPDWGHHLEPLTDGGALFHLGPHALAVALVLAGDDQPVAVRCRLGSNRPDGADDAARVEMRFSSDLIAAIDVGWSGDQPAWAAQAASASGVVRVEFQPYLGVEADGEPVEIPGRSTNTATADPAIRIHDLGYAAQLEGFASMVAGNGGRVCPAGFGRSVLDIICAAYASARRDGDEESVPFTGDRTRTPMQLWQDSRD